LESGKRQWSTKGHTISLERADVSEKSEIVHRQAAQYPAIQSGQIGIFDRAR
jgi:hypothetical protein